MVNVDMEYLDRRIGEESMGDYGIEDIRNQHPA
jgi:hypothetical protein